MSKNKIIFLAIFTVFIFFGSFGMDMLLGNSLDAVQAGINAGFNAVFLGIAIFVFDKFTSNPEQLTNNTNKKKEEAK